MVTGVSLSHSRGLGSYAGVDNGRLTSPVTGLDPWIGYKASKRITVWTVGDYGAGGLMLNPGAGAPIETGLSMAMAADGGRRQILGSGKGFGLAFKAEALWVGTRTKAATRPGGNLDSTKAAVSRMRTAIEGSQSMTITKRMALTRSIEMRIRQDGGDAETGRGMDLGAGLALADGVRGLAVDSQVRRLLVHQADGFAESAMSISVSYNPTPSTPLGLSARVSPAWGGNGMSNAEALWRRESMGGMGSDSLLKGGGNRLDTEVGYGLPNRCAVRGHSADWTRNLGVRPRLPRGLRNAGTQAREAEPAAPHRRGATGEPNVPPPRTGRRRKTAALTDWPARFRQRRRHGFYHPIPTAGRARRS